MIYGYTDGAWALAGQPVPATDASSSRSTQAQESVGRRILAAGVFVAAVEAAWQAHVRWGFWYTHRNGRCRRLSGDHLHNQS